MSDSFSDWTTKLAEAYCVLHKIPCKRKFTDAELERPLQEVKSAHATLYGDSLTQREKLARHEGRPEHDMDVFGRPLRAGT